jgi:uncharacterized spore protein YtfJ
MVMDAIKTTVEEMRKVLNIENVIGEPIESEDKIMIPVTRFGMAFGAGMGEGKGPNESGGQGAGAGGGTGIEPIAMIVVFKDVKGPEGVKLLSLKPPRPSGQAIGELGRAMVDVMKESPMMRKKPEKKEIPETKKYKTEELIKKNV